MVGLHALEPFVDQRRLAGAALGDKREDVGVAVGPGVIEALQLGVAADEALVAGLGQAGDVDNAVRQARRLRFFFKRRAYGGFIRNTLSGATFSRLTRTGVFPCRLPSRSSAAIP